MIAQINQFEILQTCMIGNLIFFFNTICIFKVLFFAIFDNITTFTEIICIHANNTIRQFSYQDFQLIEMKIHRNNE